MKSIELSMIDKKIIQASTEGLTLCKDPFEELANRINEPVILVRDRMKVMMDKGIIRRIGAIPNHYKLGFVANAMSVWDINDLKVDELGFALGRLSFVTHCYRRPRHLPSWPYNLFAMVHGRNKDEVKIKIDKMIEVLTPHFRQYELLYSRRIFKKTGLRI